MIKDFKSLREIFNKHLPPYYELKSIKFDSLDEGAFIADVLPCYRGTMHIGYVDVDICVDIRFTNKWIIEDDRYAHLQPALDEMANYG